MGRSARLARYGLGLAQVNSSDTLTITATDFAGNTASFAKAAPAGVAGSPINLGLTAPSESSSTMATVSLSNLPAGWTLNGGTQINGNTWMMPLADLGALAVTTPAGYSGAMVLNVTETWTNTDGTAATVHVSDNVEAYAPGAPIFAWSGDDNLTGTGAHDQFVLSNSIGHDTIFKFDMASHCRAAARSCCQTAA